MNKKLFKKLNEQIEINYIKREVEDADVIKEETLTELEKKVIFEDLNSEISTNLSIDVE